MKPSAARANLHGLDLDFDFDIGLYTCTRIEIGACILLKIMLRLSRRQEVAIAATRSSVI